MGRSKFRTSLIKACKHGNLAFVKCLVENGADVNYVDIKSMVPLNYVEKNPQYSEITEYLKSKGAKNNWRN